MEPIRLDNINNQSYSNLQAKNNQLQSLREHTLLLFKMQQNIANFRRKQNKDIWQRYQLRLLTRLLALDSLEA